MSNGIAKVTPQSQTRYSYPELKAMSEEISRSGLFKMNGPQILTLMLLSESTGLHPIQALTRYHVFEGRPSMRAEAMLALFQEDGGRIEWKTNTDTECEAILYHEVHCPKGQLVSFTIKDAEKAGLAFKPVWKAHPRSMLRASVIRTGVRMVDPGIILGMYTQDEIESFVDTTTSTPFFTPTATETTARESLQQKLRARVAPADRTPVAQTVADLKAAQEAPEATNGNGEKSEFRSWVEEQLEGVNAELHAIVPSDPAKLGTRTNVTAYQVGNALINEGIEEGRVTEGAILGPNGKRDRYRSADLIAALWADDPAWVMDTVGKYLANKIMDATKGAEPAQQALSA